MINAIASANPRSVVRARLQDLVDRKISITVLCFDAYAIRASGKLDRIEFHIRRELERQAARDPLRLIAHDGGNAFRDTRLRQIPDHDLQTTAGENPLHDQSLRSVLVLLMTL